MRSIKTGKKIKMLLFTALLLTTTVIVISNQKQNMYPLVNLYLLNVSQETPPVIQEKTINISSDLNFTGNIYQSIVVTADNLVIDGNGYTLQGSGSGCGFNLTNRINVTIKNVIVTGWQYGFYLENSSYNTLLSNTADNNYLWSHDYYGFYLYSNSNNNNLSDNTANHNGWGFELGSDSNNNTLSNNIAKDNAYSGFMLSVSNYNTLSGNIARYNGWYSWFAGSYYQYYGFQLLSSSYNNLSGNIAIYNYNDKGFFLRFGWYNIVTGNTIVNFWSGGIDIDTSFNNTIENNTISYVGPSLLNAVVYGDCISFYFYQQNIPSVSNFLIVGLLVVSVTVALVCSAVVSRRRKVVGAGEGVWKLPRDAFLVGTVGGIMGAVTAVIGIKWIVVVNSFLTEINIYLVQLSYYASFLFQTTIVHYDGEPFPPLLLGFYPSASSFYVLSFTMSTFLILTSVAIGIGFYGTYKAGGGAKGIVGLIFSIIGTTLGALLIIMGNLATVYMYAQVPVEMSSFPVLPVPTPNFLLMWIGFWVLGFTFILLGPVSISVRKMTDKPVASSAAGILGIIGAVFFIIGSLWYILLIIGFGLIFVAFILWSAVFYSSRNL